MKKVCAVVVFFNPEENVLKNIESYVDDVEKVYIIDNSNINNFMNFEFNNKKIEYMPLMKNMGLAYALNYGCKKAISEGYEYVLTMDQDSFFDSGAVNKLKSFMLKNSKKYSIVSPNVKSLYYDEKDKVEKVTYIQFSTEKNTERNWTMTSGSLMNLNDFVKINGFDDKMFIAHLDVDIAIKINKINKKIIVIGNSIINQHFGNSKPRYILWKKVHPSFASPVRTYYLFRNQKYLEIKYGKDIKKFINVNLFKFIVKITLFEDKKLVKYRMMYQGIKDAKIGQMGVYKGNE